MNFKRNLFCCWSFLLFAQVINGEEGEKSVGYGTKFGTDLTKAKKLKGAIGLGASPGFLSGDSEDDLVEVFKRYHAYLLLTGRNVANFSQIRSFLTLFNKKNNFIPKILIIKTKKRSKKLYIWGKLIHRDGFDTDCEEGCPIGSHCSDGICFCDSGT